MITLTLGFFDGVHRGHQQVLDALSETKVVITFENHPLTILAPEKAPPLLFHPDQKKRLLHHYGADIVQMLPFTKELASLTAEQFIAEIRTKFPFDHLILGHDSRFGRDRHASAKELAHLGFEITEVPPLLLDGKPISSSRVRSAVTAGDLSLTATLLGRPLAYSGTITPGAGKGSRIGFPTANLDLSGLCLPPYGVYAATLHHSGTSYPGVANLGVAPTLQTGRHPTLEIHLFDITLDLLDQPVEIELKSFLRPERRFASLEELQTQIAADLIEARNY
jgi:riboflavin kinase / FMN adenylyltransferase